MRFLIAGFGSIGRRHFRNLLALGEREIVFLRSKQSTLPDDEIAEFPLETDLQTALAHKPDAVIVSNPTALHLDIAIPAAESGCHLFLEKPLSHTMEGLGTLQIALQKGGGRAFVGFQFRFHPALQQIATWLSEGAIGRPLSARAHWGEYLPNWHPWEDYRLGYSARPELGGGVVLTLCHPLDYLLWLLGDVEALWAFLGYRSDLNIPVEDTAEIGLQFANGTVGSVHLNYTQRPPTHRLEIVGTTGTIRWDYDDGCAELYRADEEQWETFSPPSGFVRNDMFLAEMRHFLAVIRGEAAPVCSLEEGIRVQELLEGVKCSAATGRLVRLEGSK
jgi:predicted dehydrogenase